MHVYLPVRTTDSRPSWTDTSYRNSFLSLMSVQPATGSTAMSDATQARFHPVRMLLSPRFRAGRYSAQARFCAGLLHNGFGAIVIWLTQPSRKGFVILGPGCLDNAGVGRGTFSSELAQDSRQ